MDTIKEMRESIDNIDNAIITMLAERFEVTDRVGDYKAKNGLPPKDEAREAIQYDRINDLALEHGLDIEIAKAYLGFIVAHVVERHKLLAEKNI